MILQGLMLFCAPSRSLKYVVFSRFDEEVEGMILRGLVYLPPLFLSYDSCILPLGRSSGGYG